MGSSTNFIFFLFQSHIRFSYQRAERFRHTTKLLMLRADALRQNKHCTETENSAIGTTTTTKISGGGE